MVANLLHRKKLWLIVAGLLMISFITIILVVIHNNKMAYKKAVDNALINADYTALKNAINQYPFYTDLIEIECECDGYMTAINFSEFAPSEKSVIEEEYKNRNESIPPNAQFYGMRLHSTHSTIKDEQIYPMLITTANKIGLIMGGSNENQEGEASSYFITTGTKTVHKVIAIKVGDKYEIVLAKRK